MASFDIGDYLRQIKVKTISQQIQIKGDEAKHLIYSLRSKSGEQILVIDEEGKRALVELKKFTKDEVIGQLIKILPSRVEESITLAVAVPKRGLDDIIRQATEIGVLNIQPLLTDRVIAKPSNSKQERWKRITKEAAEQSGATEPVIKPLISLSEFINQIDGQLILCNETEKFNQISDLDLAEGTITVIVGSEGGFSENELKLLEEVGAISITLGENILRVDTAAIVALSLVKFKINSSRIYK